MHLPSLISDLALILIAASFFGILFRGLHQPLVLGYLLAGLLVGPHIWFLPSITEVEHLKSWAELGVIFLLFLLGLEFSFKKLFRVGASSFITASIEMSIMILAGYSLGQLLGWTTIESLFLGSLISISSTTIIVKTFEELNVKTHLFSSKVIGILIFEDIYAILILALLGTLAVSQTFEGLHLVIQIGKLALFLAVFIPFGLWALPKSLRFFRHYLNDETRVLLALGGCLGCVVIVTQAGFSPALGAFLMGAFIAETLEGERMERILMPVRDLFGAIFFTSVGMLVDIQILIENFKLILLIASIVIVGKISSIYLGMRVSRADKNLALQTSFSLAQIGEFSFIIATLGMTLNVIRPELYPIIVAVSVITTFTTPYFVRWAASRGTKTFTRKSRQDRQKLWDGHVVELEVHPHHKDVGKSLKKLKLRERFGITIVSIHRGDRHRMSPTHDDLLMPYDRLMVFGADRELLKFAKYLRSERFETTSLDEATCKLEKISLSDTATSLGKSLHQSGIRDQIGGLILGIERDGSRQINPDSRLVLKEKDELWLYGNAEKIKIFKENQ